MMPVPPSRTSLSLLVSACVLAFVARSVATGDGGRPEWGSAAATALVLLGVGLVLRVGLPAHDPLLFPVTALLVGLGLALLSTVKPALAVKQFVWMVLGMSVLAAAAFVRRWRRVCDYPYLAMVIALALLVLTSVAGKPTGAGGAVRLGVTIGGLWFQPSELARVVLVFFLAGFLADSHRLVSAVRPWWSLNRSDLVYLGPLLVMWGASLSLLVLQQDLGAALLYYSLFVAVLYLATARIVYVLAGLGAFAAGAAACYRFLPVVATRLSLWLDPWADAQGKGYQILQGLFSLGAGGTWGAGLGRGESAHVPAVHTDLVFAALGEQLGFVGAICVLLCYAFLVARGYRIALLGRSSKTMLLAAGLTTGLALQTFVIVAGVLKLTPLTGVTLPFLSYGGTSLQVNSLTVGILLALSTQTAPLSGHVHDSLPPALRQPAGSR